MIRHSQLFLAVFITFALAGPPMASSDEIKVGQSWGGKVPDDRLRGLAPSNNMITDSDTWKMVWKSWQNGNPTPEVDFMNNLVIVAMAHGPNQVMINRLDKDADGNVDYMAASTRMAGPGFGYQFLEVPRAGLKTIKGHVIPDGKPAPGVPNQPIDPNMPLPPGSESIQVVIHGWLQTGIMAIGGETTGTTIRANDITWELDLTSDRGLQHRANQLNGNLVQARGTLTRKRGVEIPERWIVRVNFLEEAIPAQPGPGPHPNNPPAEEMGFSKLVIETSGGLAGMHETKTIAADGSVTNLIHRDRITESYQLDPAVLSKLQAIIQATEWSKIPPVARTPNVADVEQINLTVHTNTSVMVVSTDGIAARNQKPLGELLDLIR